MAVKLNENKDIVDTIKNNILLNRNIDDEYLFMISKMTYVNEIINNFKNNNEFLAKKFHYLGVCFSGKDLVYAFKYKNGFFDKNKVLLLDGDKIIAKDILLSEFKYSK